MADMMIPGEERLAVEREGGGKAMRRVMGVLLLVGWVMGASAYGCPYCESEVGRKVAAGLFNENFGYNALLTLLPIPVFLAIVGVIHFGVPRPRRNGSEKGGER